MRRFIVRFLLGVAAAWVGSVFLPGVKTDGNITTYILVGLFLAVGEVAIPVIEGAAAVLLFFLPRSLRILLLRGVEVAVVASLVTGFGFPDRSLVGFGGFTLLLTLLYMLPFAH